MNETQRMINQALSLRQPQKDSLDILVNVLEKITLAKNMDTLEALLVVSSIQEFYSGFMVRQLY